MGGPRYEQLFRATGTLRLPGENHSFSGTGLRIRRQGVRRLEGFWGHCWQSALFPSGRGFGYIAYPPRPDGTDSYNEGYLFNGDGALVPAWVIEAPWLGKIQALGEDVSVVLESEELGRVRIAGETVVSTFMLALREEMPDFPGLYQGGARLHLGRRADLRDDRPLVTVRQVDVQLAVRRVGYRLSRSSGAVGHDR